jgi:hypothetical protein
MLPFGVIPVLPLLDGYAHLCCGKPCQPLQGQLLLWYWPVNLPQLYVPLWLVHVS